ncbi:MAG: hypothetical protein A3H93_01595 [Rhodocyclales bacterium RIFCSPLOWO2_02_FULL_63_24]|nr:MAG: hypothetical protein A2040_17055 [Rhodocyclales bacterium GWA2_65_19]OHC70104.1 MAG: hypothetical protein A3H93_01595 [Rhodocyclales bacterium RIFCSPLOWO2_02_FULL_63_24]
MKLDAKDFKRLQWAIAFLVLMALVGGGSVWTSRQLQKNSEKAFKEASAARHDIQSKLARAQEEQQELRDKIGRFQGLKSRGYIGPEQRLDWIETVARIKATRRIFRLDYEFAPQRPVDASILPGGATAGGFEIMSSQMRLQMQLLHEGELLSFLAELREAVQALIQVRSCTLERLPPGNADRGNNAQLKAECVLEWITLREGK